MVAEDDSVAPSAHPAHTAQGFLLLTLNNVEAICCTAAENPPLKIDGDLALKCVTLPTAKHAQDVWLVLRVGTYETPIAPSQVVRYARSARLFVFEPLIPSTNDVGRWALRLPAPIDQADREDQESFEAVLAQYAAVEEVEFTKLETKWKEWWSEDSPPDYESLTTLKRPVPPIPTSSSSSLVPPKIPPPLPPRSHSTTPNLSSSADRLEEEDLRGQLVLVDESDGRILGSLGDQFRLHEDSTMQALGREKDPVIIDIPDIQKPSNSGMGLGKMQTDVFVHPVPLEQQDTLMRSASLISRGLVYATDALASGMGMASSVFITHSTPRSEPLVFSERTRKNVSLVHSISGSAVTVTAKTTSLIHEAIEKAVDYVSNSDKNKNNKKKGKESDGRLSLKTRVLLSADMLLTTLERSTTHLIQHGTVRSSEALGHKYGPDTGNAALLMGQTARNVGLVYIDARGVGRRALLKKAGARYLRAKLGKRDVVLGNTEGTQISGQTQAGK